MHKEVIKIVRQEILELLQEYLDIETVPDFLSFIKWLERKIVNVE